MLSAINEDGIEIKHRGRFSMYAIDAFSQMVHVDNFFVLIDKILTGMSVGDYARLLQCALNECRNDNQEYNTREAMGIFDEVFDGIEDPDFIKLIYHAIGRISTPAIVNPQAGVEAAENEEKKSGDLTGANLSEQPLKAG